jgi:hypothetical protein
MILASGLKLVAAARLRAALTEKTMKGERHDWCLAEA